MEIITPIYEHRIFLKITQNSQTVTFSNKHVNRAKLTKLLYTPQVSYSVVGIKTNNILDFTKTNTGMTYFACVLCNGITNFVNEEYCSNNTILDECIHLTQLQISIYENDVLVPTAYLTANPIYIEILLSNYPLN